MPRLVTFSVQKLCIEVAKAKLICVNIVVKASFIDMLKKVFLNTTSFVRVVYTELSDKLLLYLTDVYTNLCTLSTVPTITTYLNKGRHKT